MAHIEDVLATIQVSMIKASRMTMTARKDQKSSDQVAIEATQTIMDGLEKLGETIESATELLHAASEVSGDDYMEEHLFLEHCGS